MAPQGTRPPRSLRNVVALILLFMCFLAAASSRADTGAVAYARPVENLTIDGDLSDWPADATSFTISEHLGFAAWEDSASFRVGYDEGAGALYVALSVRDADEVVSTDAPDDWSVQDSHLLYVDPVHDGRSSAPWIFSGNGNGDSVDPVDPTWDPSVAASADVEREHGVRRDGGFVHHEWRLVLGDAIREGSSIGIDHMFLDADSDGEELRRSAVTWGRFGAKSQRSMRMGDVVFLGSDTLIGQLRGRVAWAEGVPEESTKSRVLRITSVDDPSLHVVTVIDDGENYAVDLPPGLYEVESAFPIYGTDRELRLVDGQTVRAQVEAGASVEAPALVWEIADPPVHLLPEPGFLFDFDAESADELAHFVEAMMHHYTVPGVAVVLFREGKIVHAPVFGVRNVLTGDPVTADTLFDAGSITKPVFAYAFMRLIERGIFDLDQSLHDILDLPEVSEDERIRLFTPRLILSHQTGLPNWGWSNSDGRLDIAFDPGTGFRYSGAGYDYLGRVVETVLGESLDDVLQREALTALGVDGTARFTRGEDWAELFAFGHYILRPYAPQAPEEAHAAYGMHISAKDLARLAMALSEGRGLGDELHAEMLRAQIEIEDATGLDEWPSAYGLGLRLMESPFGRAFGHGGLNMGNVAVFEVFEERDAGYVVMTNADEGWQLRQQVRRFLIDGAPAEGSR